MVEMKFEELTFTLVKDELCPQKQLVKYFFVSDRLWDRRYVEIRPLTFGNLLYAMTRNYARIFKWSMLRILYKVGFIDIPVAESFSWKYFRFTFWKARVYQNV
jgi:hypothetical protein